MVSGIWAVLWIAVSIGVMVLILDHYMKRMSKHFRIITKILLVLLTPVVLLIIIVGCISTSPSENTGVELNSQANLSELIVPDSVVETEYLVNTNVTPFPSIKDDHEGLLDVETKEFTWYELLYGGLSIEFHMYLFSLFKFSEPEQAKAFYEGYVQGVKRNRGYKEMNAAPTPECFSYQYTDEEKQRILCYKDNVVYSVVSNKGWLKTQSKYFEQRKRL